ncbi:CMRF35-like molecule 9 [Trachypithecus francoisi]|uniref:CMRF35-like molecule 9 n=1 Tax=Trachypithecus francoisi TaxID=54180 RepID=UPI00141B2ECE|nr:CMRF35-like molecule 9 [Trachypithecus francoisi]
MPFWAELQAIPSYTWLQGAPPSTSLSARQAMETQRNEKVYLSHLPLENGRDTEDAVINIAGSMGPLTIPEPSPSLFTEIQYLSQTTEEEEAPSQAPEGDVISMPPLHTSEEELGFLKCVSV